MPSATLRRAHDLARDLRLPQRLAVRRRTRARRPCRCRRRRASHRRRRPPTGACAGLDAPDRRAGRGIDADDRAARRRRRRSRRGVTAGARPGAALPTATCQAICGVDGRRELGQRPELLAAREPAERRRRESSESTTTAPRSRRAPAARAAPRRARARADRAATIVDSSSAARRRAARGAVPAARRPARTSARRRGCRRRRAARRRRAPAAASGAAERVELHLHVIAVRDSSASSLRERGLVRGARLVAAARRGEDVAAQVRVDARRTASSCLASSVRSASSYCLSSNSIAASRSRAICFSSSSASRSMTEASCALAPALSPVSNSSRRDDQRGARRVAGAAVLVGELRHRVLRLRDVVRARRGADRVVEDRAPSRPAAATTSASPARR